MRPAHPLVTPSPQVSRTRGASLLTLLISAEDRCGGRGDGRDARAGRLRLGQGWPGRGRGPRPRRPGCPRQEASHCPGPPPPRLPTPFGVGDLYLCLTLGSYKIGFTECRRSAQGFEVTVEQEEMFQLLNQPTFMAYAVRNPAKHAWVDGMGWVAKK